MNRSRFAALIILVILLITTSIDAKSFQQNPEKPKPVAEQKPIDSVKKPIVVPKAIAKPLSDSIISIINLRSKMDTAKIDELIAIKVRTIKPLMEISNLYIDGEKVQGFKFYRINDFEKMIYFKLTDPVRDLLKPYLERYSVTRSIIPLKLSLGNAKQPLIDYSKVFYIEMRQSINPIWVGLIAIIIVVIAGYALFKGVLMDDANRFYSLGRTQLFYWTIVVVVACLVICFTTGAVPGISNTVLVILGISVATTAAAKIVENKNENLIDTTTERKSISWFNDILSDESGVNIQRLQNVLFNLLFGAIFLQRAWSTGLMPDFDSNILLLMGISSGAYAGLKLTENPKNQRAE